MTIKFYNSPSDPRVLTKHMNLLHELDNVPPYGEYNIMAPVFRVKPFPFYANCTHFEILEYHRYYFVDSITILSGNLIEIRGKVDVLKTYDNVIRSCPAICTANEKIPTSYIPDKKFPVDIRKEYITYEFDSTPFNVDSITTLSKNFVLNVAGGEGE